MHKFYLLLIIFWISKTEAQVNLQTGASQISLPLFSYSDKDNLNCNISLNYIDGNGLKVNEVASYVGTGWNIQFGGAITREQRGLPDDQKRSSDFQNPLPSNLIMTFDEYYNKYFPNGYLFSAYSPVDNISNEGGYIKMYDRNYNQGSSYYDNIPQKESIAADREQDIFHLDYSRGTAEFVIGKNGQIKVLNDSRIKVEMFQSNMLNLNIKTCIDYFVVTDTEGIQYIFSDKELSQTCTYSTKRFADDFGNIDLAENIPESSSWYIGPAKNLVPVFVGKKTKAYIVNKWYLTKVFNSRTKKAIFFNYEQYDKDIFTQRQIGYNVVPNQNINSASLTIYRYVTKELRIKNIVCASTQVNFIYDLFSRVDVPNDKALKEIQIVNSSSVVKKYLFEYGYFFKSDIKPDTYSFNGNEKFYARLCLKSMKEVGNDNQSSNMPYLFNYYTGGQSLEDIVPPSFSYWTDHWGYFNIGSYGFDRTNYRPNQMPFIGVFSHLSLEAAIYKVPVNGLAKNGIIKQVTYPSGGSLTYEYEQNDAFYNGQNIKVGGVRTLKTILYDGSDHTKDIIKEYKYLKFDEISSSGWGYEASKYSLPMNTRMYKEGGGKSGASFMDYAASIVRSFIVPSSLLSTIVQVIIDVFTPTEPDYKDESETIYSNISFQSLKPLPFQYSRVVEINKILNINHSKTVYEFTSEQETPIAIINFTFPYSNKDRYIKWAYGLPKRITIYDNDKILKETINEYNVIASFISDINFTSKKWEANKLTMDAHPSNHLSYLGQTGNITESAVYYPQIGHSELISTTERTYNKDATKYEEQLTTYTYNSSNFQPQTITSINSKGEIIKQQFYYPEDYSATGIFATLISNNMVTTPVSSETWVTKTGGQPQLINATATDFGIIGNGDIKPTKTYSLESNSPIPQNLLQSFNPNSVVRDPNYIKQQQQYEYDEFGNLIQTKGKISNAIYEISNSIYDYNGKFATMHIKNANYGSFAYTSFEAENKGGWQYNDANILQQASPTGNKCYQLSNERDQSIRINTGISTTNILSFWATNNNVQLGLALTPIKTLIGNQGWTYYEFEIPRRSRLEITGNGLIDELRLCPKGASMTTYTYDASGNVTSECDGNNRIIYYDYDALGRLKVIRDQQRDVIKSYEYNYKVN